LPRIPHDDSETVLIVQQEKIAHFFIAHPSAIKGPLRAAQHELEDHCVGNEASPVIKISDRFRLQRKVYSWAEHRRCTICDNLTVRPARQHVAKTSGCRVAHSSSCCGALLAFGTTSASTSYQRRSTRRPLLAVASCNVACCWHETVITMQPPHVRCRSRSGKHVLGESFSPFDPSRKSSTPFAMTYDAPTLPSGRAKLLSSG
jgi:hypothetical protein